MVPGSRILVDQLFVLCGLFIFVMGLLAPLDPPIWSFWATTNSWKDYQNAVAPVSPSIQLVRNAEPCMVETIVRWVAFDGPQKKDQLVIVEMLLRA
uniref:Uncharacterized protein n=1 Tax=Globodera rostochiensis TaxID=31243 RepID=A0A914H9V7_GLORO